MKNDVFQSYIKDICHEIKVMAAAAKKERKDEYTSGYAMALYEVVSLLQGQASAFQISPEDIDLADIDADKDLL